MNYKKLCVLMLAIASLSAQASELNCLAKNIYFEARGEPVRGQIAVAQVTLNRSESRNLTICQVVYERNQFSWTRYNPTPQNKAAWRASRSLAKKVLEGSVRLPNFKATYFHAKSVRPHWAKRRVVVARIGNHIFYKNHER